MSRTSLVGALLVAAGCGAGLEEGVYVATFHDRSGECGELWGPGSPSDVRLVLSLGDHRRVWLTAADMELDGEIEGGSLVASYTEAEPWEDRACVVGEWSYRAVLSAEIAKNPSFAGTVQVSELSTCETIDGKTWEYPYEEEWQFEARYLGPLYDEYPWGRGLSGLLDAGYCQ